MKKLPEAEFEVMKTIWNNEPPVTTRILMDQLGNSKGWKTPALITLLSRLTDRGFVCSKKQGKERWYYPLIEKDEYLKFETGNFIRQYHENSLTSFAAALYDNKDIDQQELEELLHWVKAQQNQESR